jgi:hypothetical protein
MKPPIEDEKMTYPNEALTSICEQLLDEWELTPEQVAKLAADIAVECACIRANRAEVAYLDRQQSLIESGGVDDSAYRRDMVNAGRGHLVRS